MSQKILMMLNLRMRSFKSAGCFSMKRYRRIGNMIHSVREGYEEVKWEVKLSFFDLKEWGGRD